MPPQSQQARHVLEARLLRQPRRVLPAIEQAVALDQRDARDQRGDAEIESRGGDLVGLAAARLGLDQVRDVGGAVDAPARIGGVGMGLDQAAADIGIQRRRRDAELGGRLGGAEGGGGRHKSPYIDYTNQY